MAPLLPEKLLPERPILPELLKPPLTEPLLPPPLLIPPLTPPPPWPLPERANTGRTYRPMHTIIKKVKYFLKFVFIATPPLYHHF